MIVIDKKTRLVGRLRSPGPVHLWGELAGEVRCGDDLTVHVSGRLQGKVHARRVHVSGQVDGEINASEEVVLAATARIRGSIRSPRIAIERGARCDVRLSMGREGQSPDVPARQDVMRVCA